MSFPDNVVLYKSTPEWAGTEIPDGVFNKHQTGEGVWGKLNVLEGKIQYVIDETGESTTLSAGQVGIIVPTQFHHVAFCEDVDAKDVKIRVDFYK